MTRTITAIFDGEVFRPTEPVDLEPNQRYVVTVVRSPEADPLPASPRSVRRILEFATDLDLPADLAAQHDHYLHGTPKR